MGIYLHYDINYQLSTRLYETIRGVLNFTMIKFPHLDSNIPTAHVYGGEIS